MATPGWTPDFGPSTPHPSAGASVIGARMPLIAYNINLATDRIDVAKKIAAAIRHSSGGFRYVKAAGFTLEDRGIVQVSMNLTNYQKTPIFRVFELVKREAARYGVAVLESEVVGLIPSAALVSAAEYFLQLERFSGDQILENKLKAESRAEPQTLSASFSSSSFRTGAIPNARILRYKLLRSTPRASAVRDMLPPCAARVRRM